MSYPIANTLKVNASNEVINTIHEEISKRLSLVWLDSEKQTIQFETNFEPECEMVAEFAARFPDIGFEFSDCSVTGRKRF